MTPQWLLRQGAVPQRVPTTYVFRGERIPMPVRQCTQPNCDRCTTGRGGYQFRWVDARWTPRAAMDLTLNPEQVRRAMGRPWPMGMRVSPSSQSSAE